MKCLNICILSRVLLPCALLHDRADELTNESQELLCVSGVELLEQGEHAEHERRPVNWVCGFPAGHSWENTTNEQCGHLHVVCKFDIQMKKIHQITSNLRCSYVLKLPGPSSDHFFSPSVEIEYLQFA